MTHAAPHRSRLMTVRPEWIDYNGHLNMAYYNVLFDRGADQLFEEFGFGPDYARDTGHSTFSAEFHVCYLREVHEGDQVYVTSQLLDFDEKRFHFFQELHHEDGWLSAHGVFGPPGNVRSLFGERRPPVMQYADVRGRATDVDDDRVVVAAQMTRANGAGGRA